MQHETATENGSNGLSESPVGSVIAIILAACLLSAGIGAVALASTETADADAAYIGYMVLNHDLDADSALAGASAIFGGTGSAASGATTYITASGTAATLGAGAAATGGLLTL